jgi:hypothetical protein
MTREGLLSLRAMELPRLLRWSRDREESALVHASLCRTRSGIRDGWTPSSERMTPIEIHQIGDHFQKPAMDRNLRATCLSDRPETPKVSPRSLPIDDLEHAYRQHTTDDARCYTLPPIPIPLKRSLCALGEEQIHRHKP